VFEDGAHVGGGDAAFEHALDGVDAVGDFHERSDCTLLLGALRRLQCRISRSACSAAA
jgi:hypothetical protein